MRRSVWFLGLALLLFSVPAFAENPFLDVPPHHWAYSALNQLAADGLLSGMPDGTFKGEAPLTRYEMAAAVARVLTKVDLDKANGQDIELVKKLVVEFKDELDALGVKVDRLDKRIAALEENMGGWNIQGDFLFLANWTGEDNSVFAARPEDGNIKGKEDFTLDRLRLDITKRVNDRVSLFTRIEAREDDSNRTDVQSVSRAYAIVKFPGDVTARVGKMDLNWEADFYTGDFIIENGSDAYVTDLDYMNAFAVDKSFANGDFQAFVGHYDAPPESATSDDMYLYGGRLAYTFNEKFGAAINYIGNKYRASIKEHWNGPGSEVTDLLGGHSDFETTWVDAIANLTPSVTLKGQFFWQKVEDSFSDSAWSAPNSPRAWKLIASVKQDVLKFTDLWVEYAEIDQNFHFTCNPYVWALSERGSSWLIHNDSGYRIAAVDSNVWNIVAKQQWNDQWWTYVHYVKVDASHSILNTPVDLGYDEWGISVRYNYTPSLFFELVYDDVQYSNENSIANTYHALGLDDAPKSDHLIQFRTYVSFY